MPITWVVIHRYHYLGYFGFKKPQVIDFIKWWEYHVHKKTNFVSHLKGFWGICFGKWRTWNVELGAEMGHHVPVHSCRRIWGHTQCSSTEWAMGKTVMANCVLGWMFYLLQSWWILLRVWGTVRQSSGEKFNQTFFGFPWTAYHFPFFS